jgi:hypothetical protein
MTPSSDTTKRVPRWVWITTAILAALVAGLIGWIYASPLFWGTRMADAWTSSRATLVPLAFIALMFAAPVRILYREIAYRTSDSSEPRVRATAVATYALGIMGFLMLLPVLPFSPARDAYRAGFDATAAFADGLVETTKPRPAYDTRLNSVMADSILRASLQDTVAWIAEDSRPQYSVVDGDAAWCVGLLARHRVPMAADRVYTTGTTCLVEKTMRVVRADWDTRVPSTQGAFSTNLHKYVARLKRGLSVSESDIRFYITDGKPHMLAPVTKLVTEGMQARRVTAGFVTVDPTGRLKLHTSAKPGQWPVPVVAYSTAESIRESANTRSGYYCRTRLKSPKCVEKASPLEDTSSIDGAAGAADPNAGNATEFVLRRADGRLVMVTPLTPYGAARNVVAYLEVLVDELAPGRNPQATLYRVTPEASGVAIAQAVTAAYTADIAWISEVTEDAARKAASRIFEITPAGAGTVVATIGNETNPEYWLTVRPQLQDGSLEFTYCIREYRTGTELDCRTSIEPPARIGTLRGLSSEPDTPNGGSPSTPTVVTPDVDVSKLTDDELAKLGAAVLDELARRAK